MIQLEKRESVIFAEDFDALVNWYKTVLGFAIKRLTKEDYHYCLLENDAGIRLGIAHAQEMGITPSERHNNSIVLQFQVSDVPEFFTYLSEKAGGVTFGPNFDKKDGFWFGGFHDLEGNPFWVVDENCPD